MITRQQLLRDLVLSSAVGIFLGLSILGYNNMTNPNPYGEVVLREFTPVEDGYYLEANFEKYDYCTFERLTVFGFIAGEWVILEWRSVDGDQGDRDAGYHTLRLLINTQRTDFDRIGVRTRHLCGEVKSDRVFITIPVDSK